MILMDITTEKDDKLLVTKEVRDASEEEINGELERLKKERDSLLMDEEPTITAVKSNKKLFKKAKKTFKLQKKSEKEAYKAAIRRAREEHRKNMIDISKPYNKSKTDLAKSIEEKRNLESRLAEIRAEIVVLQKKKALIGKMYISEKEEYIDINELPKNYTIK